jgi:hypothetical protein
MAEAMTKVIFSAMAPGARFELATNRLTVDRSTAELPRIDAGAFETNLRFFSMGFAE